MLIISIAPVAIIAIYLYIRDKYEREPFYMLLKGLFLGAMVTLVVVGAGLMLNAIAPQGPRLLSLLYESFIVAAFNEELMKFLVFMVFIWRDKNFNENFDGIIYAVFISLGFACVENILYVFGGGIGTGLVRAITAVPAHAIFGIIMGYFLAKAKFILTDHNRNLALAIFSPILLHGIYDTILFLISEPDIGAAIIFLVVLFILFVFFLYVLGFRKITESVESSQFKNRAREDENIPKT